MKTSVNPCRQRGAAALEFAIVLPVVIAVILVFFDLSRYLILQGQLNRTSYSLVNMIAHRQAFYVDQAGQKQALAQSQLDELLTIAKRLVGDPQLGVSVHEVARVGSANNGYQGFSSGSGCQQKTPDELRALYQTLDDPNEDQEQVLYLIELCQPLTGFSFFARFSGSQAFTRLYASSVMVER
ncbi:hypothetical protein DXX93_04855 [Thalassotalea euphylliae]|uniref:Pilus assembly protein n=1 Tax=Thalassotalea euphylliae TaxID=1655234 RepID=A0A3E0TNM9_9GAMM|nr:tight adherence pilus pseudopilin TadF [Thalassotalea euphylliae]REL25957.1 hypothetical protein DXX93_04855 [Thalassotalea euphylliae]